MNELFSAWKRDLRGYDGRWHEQGYWALVVYRFGKWRYGIKTVWLRKLFSLVYKVLFKLVQVVTGIELPAEAEVGEGTRIDHFGNIIVSGYAKLGKNCVLRQGVTIGLKNETDPVAPEIGDFVSIGAGAKLLGSIRIGNHVDIGANAVVLCDIPDNCIAVGIPAVIRRKVS